jgi:protein involved in polysaccharide export with SLBB domain
VPREYVIQAGDVLEIKAFNIPEVQDSVTVRPDGKISLLLLDDVTAAGSTPEELDRLLTERYGEHYRSPQITVVVRTFSSQKVFVAGEVNQPGLLPLVGEMTAVLQASGFRSTARTDSVILIRKGEKGEALVRKLDLEAMIEKGKPDEPLQPFDFIFVPKSKIAKVNQFVDQYIEGIIPFTLTGGFTYILGNTVVIP